MDEKTNVTGVRFHDGLNSSSILELACYQRVVYFFGHLSFFPLVWWGTSFKGERGINSSTTTTTFHRRASY